MRPLKFYAKQLVRDFFLAFVVGLILGGTATSCSCQQTSTPTKTSAPSPTITVSPTTILPSKTEAAIRNDTNIAAIVYLSFGADSVVTPTSPDWSFCATPSTLNCSFFLDPHTVKELPLHGQYTNVTVSFDKPVECGVTKAELNLNNPSWYNTVDISLVDGFSNFIEVATPTVLLGPPNGETGNERVYGVFPYGCDVCVARQNPPCDIAKGTSGCKTGTQYNPDVPCQWQGSTMGGDPGVVTVRLLAGVPL